MVHMAIPWKISLLGGVLLIVALAGWVLSAGAAAPATRSGDANGPTTLSTSTLWVLAIGVSRYQEASLQLQFAEADARAIAASLSRQGGTSLYRSTQVRLLTDEEVSRDNVLDGIARFLGQAGPNDVAVLFLAGHGVQDRSTRSYYFLPYGASAANHLTAGVRMSDFDEMLRIVRQNARAVILILDTCHAGALRLTGSNWISMEEPSGRLSVGEGVFLLAAAKPGEESEEDPALAHGVFTHAVLQGLQGAADTDRDGKISVGDLFSFVARRVPELSSGAQHPYYKIEGSDVPFAVVDSSLSVTATTTPSRAAAAAPALLPNTIAVLEFHNVRAQASDNWIGIALRTAFNTELNKVRALNVYAPELIDRALLQRSTDPLITAKRFGIHRVITGSFSIVGATLRIDARIIDTASGLQEGSDSVEGPLPEFFGLQKRLVLQLLRRLRVTVSAEEGTSIERKSNTDVDAYRLLLETEGELPNVVPTVTPSRLEPLSGLGRHIADVIQAEAWAADLDAQTEQAARRLIHEYRDALQAKDVDRVAALYVSFPDSRRQVLRVYFDNATALQVTLDDIKIAPHEDGIVLSFLRRDHFVDRESGKTVDLEVRLTRVAVASGEQWKIAGKP